MGDLTPTQGLINACKDEAENCAFTATTFIIYLRRLRIYNGISEAATVIFGALAAWKIVANNAPALATVFFFLATVIPLVTRALKLPDTITQYSIAAGEYTNLRDRFTKAAEIDSHKPFPEFEKAVAPFLDRLERLRAQPLTPPEWCFEQARTKHKDGHYKHDHR
jgi:hypothetical protein